MSEGNDFALELMVGIQDMFTQQAKKIDAEVNKLEKDTTALQKTFDDTTAYKKAAAALEDMARAGDATAEQLQQQERVVDELAGSLKKAGVDINNITRDEAKLAQQLKQTNQELSKRGGFRELVSGGLKSVASATMLAAFARLGGEREKIEQMMRKQSTFTQAQISGEEERKFRIKTVGTYNVSAGEVAGVQTYFNRTNHLTGQANYSATTAALQLGNLLEGKADQDSINRALSPLIRSGIKPGDAAAMIYSTFTKGGGDVNDLLDATQEYFGNLHSRGLSAKQFFSAMIAGTTKGGVYSYDKIGDSLKETFAARLTDPGTVQQILGHGKQAGAIEQITDPVLYSKFNDAMHQFQQHQMAGKNTVGDVTRLYGLLGEIRQKSPGALQNLSTYIGGTMLAEDSGVDAATPISDALKNPNASLGNYRKDFAVNPDDLLTSTEKAEAARKAGMEGLSNAAGDATKQLNGFAGTLQSLSMGMSDFMTEHPTLTHIGTDAALVGTAYLGARRGWKTFKYARTILGGGGASVAADAELSASTIGRGVGAGTAARAGKGNWLARGAKLGGALDIAGNGLTAISGISTAVEANHAGDRRAADEALGSTAGSVLLGTIGGGIGSVLLGPGAGTAAGWIAGGWLGGKIGGWLGDVGYDLFNSGSDDKRADTQLDKAVSRLPDPDTLVSATGDAAGMQGVTINIAQNFNINAMSASPEDISTAIQSALRHSNPELMQELEYALSQLMLTNDHQRPSN